MYRVGDVYRDGKVTTWPRVQGFELGVTMVHKHCTRKAYEFIVRSPSIHARHLHVGSCCRTAAWAPLCAEWVKAHSPCDMRAPQGAELLLLIAPSAQSGCLFWVCVRA